MKVDLDKDTEHLVRQEVEAGRFPGAAEFVHTAVQHFLLTRENLGHSREQVDAMIAVAVASLERGEGIDGEKFFSDLEKKEREINRQRG